MNERRQPKERRRFSERRTPGAAVDVTRVEHENLYDQVTENVRVLRRVEAKLNAVFDLLEHRPRLKDGSEARRAG